MNATRFAQYAGAVGALAILSACGGSAVAPSNAALGYVRGPVSLNGRLVTAARPNPGGLLPHLAIVPDRAAKTRSKYYEYVINNYGSYAGIFNYPKSTDEIGTIGNVGGQGCTNVLYGYGRKIFWIVAGADQITEYKVPKKAIKTLSVSDNSMPSSCAMNTSGDLAVGILNGPSSGDIVLYKNATGSGTFIKTPLADEFFDGYDNHGNLFADGFGSAGFMLVELPNGSNKAKTITTSNTVNFPGSVQWDGTYVTVFDQTANKMYRYTISGSQATLKGTISFSGSSDCAQTWIVKALVYCGDAGNDNGSVFKYPAGGSQLAVFTGNFDEPLGVVAAKR
ncbi:MAG TPA: hypothetical protein VHS56_10605 [Candidatus Cybelea sp.]|nr:hypothetical protein [Candidatus Cybelea sp.]